MSTTMKAVDIKGGAGGSDALFINADTPKPAPADGEALVQVRAFGINRMDILQRKGGYPVPPQAPKTLGVEFSGTIVAVGGGDHGVFNVGDEVLGLAYGGAYAEYIAVSSKMLMHKPAGLSYTQCAALPETWITATQALHTVLGFAAGKSILWHAGASGVSVAGIQLSKLAGASEIYATAGSDDKCAFVEGQLGATACINYKTQDWAAVLKEKTGGKGVDYIVDFIGAPYWQKNIDVIARDGSMVMLGFMGGSVASEVNLSQLLAKRLTIHGSSLRSRDPEYQGKLRDKLESYLPQFEAGHLKIFLDTVLPWEKIAEAHNHMEDAGNLGKIVCTID